jgi:hypothetical protein
MPLQGHERWDRSSPEGKYVEKRITAIARGGTSKTAQKLRKKCVDLKEFPNYPSGWLRTARGFNMPRNRGDWTDSQDAIDAGTLAPIDAGKC